MMKYIPFFSVLLLSACCTMFSSSSQSITFDSNVKERIQIYADGALVCNKTPCVVEIDRHSGPMNIVAKAKGYEDTIMQNKSKLNPVFWANVLFIYPTSSTTDFATNAMWKYSQDGIYINMEKKGMNVAEKAKFNKDSRIRHYVLYSYAEIKIGNPEYMKALMNLTGMEKVELNRIIASSLTEVELANNLTNG